jgi:hypothetical protein
MSVRLESGYAPADRTHFIPNKKLFAFLNKALIFPLLCREILFYFW